MSEPTRQQLIGFLRYHQNNCACESEIGLAGLVNDVVELRCPVCRELVQKVVTDDQHREALLDALRLTQAGRGAAVVCLPWVLRCP